MPLSAGGCCTEEDMGFESGPESRWGVCSSWSVREFTPLMLKSGRLLTYRLRASMMGSQARKGQSVKSHDSRVQEGSRARPRFRASRGRGQPRAARRQAGDVC